MSTETHTTEARGRKPTEVLHKRNVAHFINILTCVNSRQQSKGLRRCEQAALPGFYPGSASHNARAPSSGVTGGIPFLCRGEWIQQSFLLWKYGPFLNSTRISLPSLIYGTGIVPRLTLLSSAISAPLYVME